MKKTAIPAAILLTAGVCTAVYRGAASFIAEYHARALAMERGATGEPEPVGTSRAGRSPAQPVSIG